jgi:hypothetical protein
MRQQAAKTVLRLPEIAAPEADILGSKITPVANLPGYPRYPKPLWQGTPADAGESANRPNRAAVALSAMRARPRRGISSSTWSRCVRISMTAPYGGQAPVNRGATIVFAPI